MSKRKSSRWYEVRALLDVLGVVIALFIFSNCARAEDKPPTPSQQPPTFAELTLPGGRSVRVRPCQVNIIAPALRELAPRNSGSEISLEEFEHKLYVQESPEEALEAIEDEGNCGSYGFTKLTLLNNQKIYIRSCNVHLILPVLQGTASKSARTQIVVDGISVWVRDSVDSVQKLVQQDGHCEE